MQISIYNGTYMILYLSPSHYHRIHSPVKGTIVKQWSLGSKSYPVNKMGLKYGVRTLAKNYRMITEVNTDYGHTAIVKVGAMFVNSIETTHTGSKLEKGEEMAYFSFGSTVVLVFEKGIFQLDSSIHTPKDIRIGEKIGSLSEDKRKSPLRGSINSYEEIFILFNKDRRCISVSISSINSGHRFSSLAL